MFSPMVVVHPKTDLLILSQTISDVDFLQSNIVANSELLLIDTPQDLFTQLQQRLTELPSIYRLHIVTHGHPGAIEVNGHYLDSNWLLEHTGELAAIGKQLGSHAEIGLYGCEVASGVAGEQFVTILQNLTSAAVFASTTVVGASDLGGDWQLDWPIQARVLPLPFQPQVLSSYRGVFEDPLFDEEKINTVVDGRQELPQTIALAGGGYVVVWQSPNKDGSGLSVVAQLFTAAGVPLGTEILVNSSFLSDQFAPAVAATEDGGFVVGWTDNSGQDGSGSGVYGQRFDAGGVKQGAEFQINTETFSTQNEVTLTGLAGGGFVALYSSQGLDGSGLGIAMQRYDASGNALGSETVVNTSTSSNQQDADVAAIAGGGFIVSWTDTGGADGNGGGILGQRFNNNGVAVGSEFIINQVTAGTQNESAISVFDDGSFVVTWTDQSGLDGSSWGVFGRLFNADGTPKGDQFQINTTTSGTQYQSDVLALPDGRFVVVWYDSAGGGGVTKREFDATGTPLQTEQRVGGLPNLNDTWQPALVDLGNGNYSVIYTEWRGQDGSDYGIYQQMFADPAEITRQGNPELEAVNAVVTYSEATVNAAPQLIDKNGAVAFSDADSANFDGGVLEVSYLLNSLLATEQFLSPDDLTQSQLSVRNQGTAAGQIGLSGSSVSYGGTVIATLISDGSNGSKLTIALNANATVAAVEALVENLTYQNLSDDPINQFQLAITITDGDGGSTGSIPVTVNILTELDGAEAVGGETQVNSFITDEQDEAAIASLSGGGYVITWVSQNQDGSGDGIYAQRFDANGVIIGPEFLVNSVVQGGQFDPHVAGLAAGGFVISWTDNNGTDGSGQGVFSQAYDASGAAVGGQVQVNTQISGTQNESSIAGLNGGGYVVTWTGIGDGSGVGIIGQRFDAAGVAQGGEFIVNSTTTSSQGDSDLVGLNDGGFVVVWTDQGGADGASWGTFGQRFNASGVAVDSEFQVNTNTVNSQYEATVAALSDGGFVVVWRDDSGLDGSGNGVFGQRYDASGSMVGGEFRVNENTSSSQFDPSVVGLDEGGFVVVWRDDSGRDGSGTGVFGQQYDADGHRIDGEFQVNTEFSSTQYQGVVAALPNGNFVTAWSAFTSAGSGDGDRYGIFQQLWGDPAEFSTQQAPEIDAFNASVSYQENTVNAAPQLLDINNSVAFSDADSTDFDGGSLLVSLLNNPEPLLNQLAPPDDNSQDQLGVRNEGTGTGLIGVSGTDISFGGTVFGSIVSDGSNGSALEISFNANASVDAVETLLENLTYQNTSNDPSPSRQFRIQVADGDGGSSVPQLVTVNIVADRDGAEAVGGESQVNSFIAGDQDQAAIASLSGGGYVITWVSQDQDGNSTGIYGQRFGADGVLIGPEFLVNSVVQGGQFDPHVTGLAAGGFVISWTDNNGTDGSGQGVFSQAYGASGAAVGGQVQVNTVTSGTQNESAIASLSGGGYVVTWTGTGDGSGAGIIGQRFDAAGVAQGGEFIVNSTTTSSQGDSDLVGLNDGGFVVVWTDQAGADGASWGTFGQRFNASGVAVDSEFQVNTNTVNSQYEATVAALSDGGFVVVWRDDSGLDGSGNGVFGQRYDASGSTVGGEFRVNENTSSSQYDPSVVGLDEGGFVVVWRDDSGRDGSGTGVFGQQYDADGHRIDGEFQVNTEFSSVQYQGVVAALPNGNFVTAWSAFTSAGSGDGDRYGIFQQLWGDPAEFNTQQSPQIDAFNASVSYQENTVNAAPQLLDINNSVAFSDADSTDLDGGSLLVSLLNNPEPLLDQLAPPDDNSQVQLGVRNEGTGTGLIGVSGTDISFGGTVFGSIISDGSNGSALEISFNANASVDAVETLLENLTYQNTSDDPSPSQQFRIQVADGDGGTSVPHVLTVNIVAERDGAEAVGGESQVNSFIAGDQDQAAIASLSGGGYVITWISQNQDGSGDGIYAQRFDANGVLIGPEFLVNSVVQGGQFDPHVTGLAAGGFVISWTDNNGTDGSGWGVFSQAYDASGVAVGGQVQVNTVTSGTQNESAIASLSGGGYVVTWTGTGDGSGAGIIGQRFDAAGVAQGGEFNINTTTTSNQGDSDLVGLNDGGFVVVWTDQGGADGASWGTFGQRFNASGVAVDSEFQVNTNTVGSQYEATVAALSDGGFVVVWRDDSGLDGSANGVFGQRYDASGSTVGGEFRVNENTSSSQYDPSVVGLDEGGFVVVWRDDSGRDGSGTGVFGQQYDADGHRIDGEFQVNTEFSSVQYQGVVAALPNGNFVTAWSAFTSAGSGDGSSYGIFQQLWGDPAEFSTQQSPVLGDVGPAVTFLTANIIAAPQIMDDGVSLADADSVDFDGGSLTVDYVASTTAIDSTDQLGVNNQGTAAGQISVSGTAIAYGGTNIGTLASNGSNGVMLTVNFNANATVEAVQALIENLTYQTTNITPPNGLGRTMAIAVTDGDGGRSVAETISVTINDSQTLPVISLADVTSVVTYVEDNLQASPALLDAHVQFSDNSSAGFDGGALTLNYISTATLVDQLAVRNEGSAAGQIGVSGNDITFGGLTIGTLDGTADGVNGNNLRIQFNAAAAEQSIEALIENLTYQNISDVPNSSRNLRLNVTDGAANSTANADIQVVVTPSINEPQRVGGEQQVNSFTEGAQDQPAIATLANGGYVIVWESAGQDGSSEGVFGQRYDANGVFVGPEFLVNSTVLNDQNDPAVAALSDGGFVVSWTDTNTSIYAQRYDVNGNAAGGEIQVNSNISSIQFQSDVVGLADGSFVVVWAAFTSGPVAGDGSGYGVVGRHFDASGNALGTEFVVNTEITSTQDRPAIASTADGGFVVVWESDTSGTAGDGSNTGVYGRRFELDGGGNVVAVDADEFRVNTETTNTQDTAVVAGLTGGGFVVAWASQNQDGSGTGVFAQRYDAAGSALGAEFRVNETTVSSQSLPAIAALANGGFVISWEDNSGTDGSGTGVFGQQYDAAGNRIDEQFQLNTEFSSTQASAVVSGLSNGNFVAAWYSATSGTAGDGSGNGVFQQIFGDPADFNTQASPELGGLNSTITYAENTVNASPQLLDANGSVGLSDADSADFDGGSLLVSRLNLPAPLINQLNPPDDLTQDQLGVRNEGSGAGEIGVSGSSISYAGTVIGTVVTDGSNGAALEISFNSNATGDAVEALIENLTYQNSSDNPLDSRQYRIQVSDGDGGSSKPQVVTVNISQQQDGVSALFGEQQVNSFIEGAQDQPAIATLASGGYVIVWNSEGQDGSSEGIFGQRYDANGVFVGPEFLVNSTVLGSQNDASVAALSGGGFVVSWTDANNSIYAQRYDVNGNPAGGEIQVNSNISSIQFQSAVVGLADGSFVVTWAAFTSGPVTSDGSGYGVVGRHFDASGNALGAEFVVNTETASTQDNPAIASTADGGFVVVWDSATSGTAGDGNSTGVFGRRFELDGGGNVVAVDADEFQVNTETSNSQGAAVVAGLSGGGFVVAWASQNQDSSGSGVFAQRYDAAGTAVGEEFRVNETTVSSQSLPAIAALANGGFVISWEDNSGTDGSGTGVFGQQYDAAGNRIDEQFQLNTEFSSTQASAVVSGLSNGNFVAAWYSATSSTAGDGSSNGVFQQIFGDPADFNLQAPPELGGLNSTVTYAENTVNASPQLLDANGSVGLSDADSADFDGGSLLVSRLNLPAPLINQLNPPDDLTQDQLGVRNEGTGAEQIGISGSTVTYGGVVIGTVVTDGSNGTALEISFNSNATGDAVEALIENLTYQNSSDNPLDSRQYRIQVSDGDGGSSKPQVVTVNISQQQDGVSALFGEQQVNSFIEGAQDQPAIATLANGGYVIVWNSFGQDGSSEGVFGQRYDANGVFVGPEFLVNSTVLNNQNDASVAALSAGGFVVSWTDANNSIFAQRYDVNGNPAGGAIQVNSDISSIQYQSAVVGLADGSFVVTWAAFTSGPVTSDGSGYGVVGRHFDASGNALGAEFVVNTETASTQDNPAIASTADGGFVVVWDSATSGTAGDGNSTGVFGRRFELDGGGNVVAVDADEFQVNTETSNSQGAAVVAGLSGGGFVVAWASQNQDSSGSGVFAQRYNAAGTAVGEEFRVNETTVSSQSLPAIAALANGGFVISWEDNSGTDGSGTGVFGQQYDAAGNRIDEQFQLNTEFSSTQASAVVSGLSNGNFVAAWYSATSSTAGDGDGNGVFQQIFGDPADFVSEAAPELEGINAIATYSEQSLNAAPRLLDINGAVALSDVNSVDFDGGSLLISRLNIPEPLLDQFNAPDDLTQDQLGVRNEGTGAEQIGISGSTVTYGGVVIGTVVVNGVNGNPLQINLNANATIEAVENLVENITYRNISDDPLLSHAFRVQVSDGDGGSSIPQIVTVKINPTPDGAQAFFGERQANTETFGSQSESDMATLDDGTFVMVWTSVNQDGSGDGVYGQRFDAEGNALGAEFLVNSQLVNAQDNAAVASLTGGGFVVSWQDNNSTDGSGHGVFAQRYATDGTVLGGEFQVNTATSSTQWQPDIIGLNDGSFVVVWSSFNSGGTGDGSGYGVFGQRFDAAGNSLGSEFQINTETASTQDEPSVARLSDGGFVVTWTSASSGTAGDGSSDGVFGQRFAADGTPVSSEFQVNTESLNQQENSVVAGLAAGGFVVAWQSNGQDTSGEGIFAQRFDSDGNAVAREFRVNDTTVSGQSNPAIVALDTGGFVISWEDNSGTDGSGVGVFAQQYGAEGNRLDSQIQVNTEFSSTQNQASITSLENGGFAIGWTSATSGSAGDGNGNGVFYQLYRNVAPVSTDVFATGIEDQPVILDNVLFESGFNDPDGQGLAFIVIDVLPNQGQLLLNGSPVNAGDQISLAELASNQLVYQGIPDFNGTDAFGWRGSDGLVLSQVIAQTNIDIAPVNDAPGLDAGVDGVGVESFGTNFSRTLALTDPDNDTFLIEVDWGDGTAVTSFTTANTSPTINHRYLDDGSYVVQVTVNDQAAQANSIESQSFNVTINNVAPVMSLSGDPTVEEFQTYTLTLGNPSDPGDDTVTEYRIDWGDGSAIQTIAAGDVPANRQITHVFSDSDTVPNDYTINVSVTDEDGSFDNIGSLNITVAEPTEVITVDAGADFTVNEGTGFNLPVSYTDPTDQGGDGWSYTIDWGDGTAASVGNDNDRAFLGFHSYADDGTYTATVTVNDISSGQAAGVDTVDITVDNVAPSIFIGGSSFTPEGSLYTLTLTTADPGDDTITDYLINWGDGSAEEAYTSLTFPANNQLQHLYTDGQQVVTITATVTDEDGTFNNSRDITVSNVAPTVALSGADNVDEGAVYILTIGAVTDPGLDTVTNYVINWGDGTASATSTPGDITHVYADGISNPTITVNVQDEDGIHNNAGSLSLTVNNVDPTIALSGAASTDEGDSYTLTLGAITDPGDDTVTNYIIDWGDGSSETIAAVDLPANGEVSHVYADGPANATINVDLEDEDGVYVDAGSLNLTVNNVAPTLLLSGAAIINTGQLYALTIGDVVDPGDDTVSSYVIDWGDGSSDAIAAADLPANGEVTHTYTISTDVIISIDLVDEDGSYLDVDTLALTVNTPPAELSVSVGDDAALDEGSTFSRLISFTDGEDMDGDGWEYSIDWGDGTSLETGSTTDTSFTISRDLADGLDTQTVAVTVNDGEESATESFVLTTNNVAPTIALSGAASTDEGDSYTLTLGAITDPGDDTVTNYIIDWGDGSSDTIAAADLPATGEVSHVYADGPANATISVDLEDEDGVHVDAGALNLTVNNVAPTLAINGADSVDEGSSYTLNLGAIVDPGDDTYSIEVDWGDGTIEAVAVGSASINHVFADGLSNPTIAVTVTDSDGDSSTASQAVTVNNVAPTIALSGADSTDEGDSYTLTLGAITDPGDDTVTNYVIDWGDGSSDTIAAADLPATGEVSHIYADGPANATISVDLEDEDGVHVDAGTLDLTVNNVAPTLAINGADSVDEGSSYTLNLGAIVDPGDDTYSIEVDWGDGTVEAVAVGSASINHVFADGLSNPTIAVTVTDSDGDSSTASQAVTVNNVAPTLLLSGAATINTGQLYALTIGDVVDPGDDTVSSYVIDWGDGSSDTIAAADLPANGEVTHTYTISTDVIISIDLVDEDGSYLDVDTLALTVNTPPAELSVSVGDDAALDEGSTFSRLISFTDGEDMDGDGWEYSIDWGDGTSLETGSTTDTSFTISRDLADGFDTQMVAVTVNDGEEAVTESFVLTTNNVAPTIALSGAASTDEGDSYTLTLGAITDPGDDTVENYIIDWGDGSSDTIAAVDLPATGEVSHIYADGPANATISVDLEDEDGVHVDAGTLDLTVNNVAPTLAINGADSVDEGSSYTLNLGAIVDPGDDTYSIEVDWGDGTIEAVAVGSASINHVFADGLSNPTIAVTVTDSDGDSSTASQAVTVNNVAPTLLLSGAATINTGQLYALTIGDVVDPGDDTVSSYVIDWGDGSSDTIAAADLPANGEVTHTYTISTDVIISIDLVDEDGSYLDVDTLALTVNTPPAELSVSVGDDAALDEGSTFSRLISFTDGEDMDGDGWEYSIDWGDGTSLETGSTTDTSFTISRDLADGFDTQMVAVTVNDGEEAVTESFVLTTNNVAPTIALSGAASTDEGDSYTLTLGAITDPGDDTVTNYVIDWGDGSSDTIAAADLPATGEVSHIYADGPANATISVDLEDEDGVHVDAGTLDLTVNNVAPTLAINGADSVDEGSSYTLNLGAIVDPGDDTYSIEVDWGDGTVEAVAVGSASINHVFADGLSNPTIAVTVTDSDGDSSTASQAVTVNNVAPTLLLSGAAIINTGQLYALTIGDVVDPGDDTVSSYVIDWGDGSSETIAAADLPANGEVTHTYTISTDVIISIDLVDEDGSYIDVDTLALMVNDATPDNLPPVAQDDTIETDEDTAVVGNVLADNGAGVDSDPDGDQLTVVQVNGMAANVGTQLVLATTGALLILNSDGGFSYNPNGQFEYLAINESATDSFEYTISDGKGGESTATVMMTINGVNDAPIAGLSEFTTDEDSVFSSGNVLDTDFDPDTNDVLVVSAVEGDVDGINSPISLDSGAILLLRDDGSFIYDPNNAFENLSVGDSTVDSFEYTVIDNNGGSSTATAVVTVLGVNDAPETQADVYTTDEDSVLTMVNVLDNDTDIDDQDVLTVSEVNGDDLAVGQQIMLASGALLTLNADGSLEYDPNGAFEALNTGEATVDMFNYTVSDGNGGVQTEQVSINVDGITDEEVAIIRLGDAPDRLSRRDPGAWRDAWTDDAITITHRADYSDTAEPWSDIVISSNGGNQLAGGDIHLGDLGVSGQSLPTGLTSQEIDGSEALRFELAESATGVTVDLTLFNSNDDGNGNAESVRLQAFNADGDLVGETVASADSSDGKSSVTLDANSGFTELVVTSGVYDGDSFVFGGLADASGGLGQAPDNSIGSDMMLEAIEFEFGPVTAALPAFSANSSSNGQATELIVAEESSDPASVIGMDIVDDEFIV